MKALVVAAFLLTQMVLLGLDACAIDYPVVAIKSVRQGDETFPNLAEVFDPIHHPPSDLVVIYPDGREDVLVSGNGVDAILDPKTLDGINVYFVRIPDCNRRNRQRRSAPINGADIYSINIQTREMTRWTDQYDEKPSGYADWSRDRFKYGVFNMGPQPLPDGRLVYASSRRRLSPTKSYSGPCMQLHVRHPDGRIECIGPMSQGSALHPELLRDGRIAFSSFETMGMRDQRRWSLWQIHPDGTNWGPLISSYGVTAFHFHSQRTSGEIVCTEYYNLNNEGFGTLMGLAEYPTYSDPDQPVRIPTGWHFNHKVRYSNYPFAPSGFRNLTFWTHHRDEAATAKANVPAGSGVKSDSVLGDRLGKVTHPSAAPDNAILLTFSGGPCCKQKRPTRYPTPHCEIRLLPSDVADAGPDGMPVIAKQDGYNYTQPRALVSHQQIYGMDPVALPSKVDHTKSFGVFGSADAFAGQWKFGLDSGSKGNPESVVMIGTEPNIAKIYGPNLHGSEFSSDGWETVPKKINERFRVLGEYFFDQPDRPEGDYSFRVKVPADVPFTVAIRADDGRFLTCGQSWKQVRPGYQEVKCGGCHNHAGEPISGEGKYAWRDDYVLRDFTGQWRHREFNRDVMPILKEHCYECHAPGNGERLVLDADGIRSVVKGLQAAKSSLSHRIRGEHGLKQMPLDRPPLKESEIRVIDEWIDLGGLIDHGSGAAFDVWFQNANPNPVDEAIALKEEERGF